MYIPGAFQQDDETRVLSYMRAYSFALLVSVGADRPVATHLPFVVEERDGRIKLYTHMSGVNPQSALLESSQSLAIFQGPHAYISPSLYFQKQQVPTWDYVAVHAYGTVSIIESSQAKTAVLEKMIRQYEYDYLQQWEAMPYRYKQKMLDGIVAFEMQVEEIQCAEKLSQNKTVAERKNIIGHFEHSHDPHEVKIAELMKEGIT